METLQYEPLKDSVTTLPVVQPVSATVEPPKKKNVFMTHIDLVLLICVVSFIVVDISNSTNKNRNDNIAVSINITATSFSCELDMRIDNGLFDKHLSCDGIIQVLRCMRGRLDIPDRELTDWSNKAMKTRTEWFQGCDLNTLKPSRDDPFAY